MAAGFERMSSGEGGFDVLGAAASGAKWIARRTVEVVTRPLDMSEERLGRLPLEVQMEAPERYAAETERAVRAGESDLAQHTVGLALHSLARLRDLPEVGDDKQAHIAEQVMEATERARSILPEDATFALPELEDGIPAERPEDVIDDAIWGPVTDVSHLSQAELER